MRDVVLNLKVFHLEVFDVVHFTLELDCWEGVRLALELNFERLDVVVVDVRVAQGVNELASFESCNKNKQDWL